MKARAVHLMNGPRCCDFYLANWRLPEPTGGFRENFPR